MKGIIIPDQNQSECVNNIWDKVSNFSDDSRTINYFWINTKNSRFIFDIFWRTIYFAQIAAKHYDDCVDSCSFYRIKYHRVKPDPTRKSDLKAGKVYIYPILFLIISLQVRREIFLKMFASKFKQEIINTVPWGGGSPGDVCLSWSHSISQNNLSEFLQRCNSIENSILEYKCLL